MMQGGISEMALKALTPREAAVALSVSLQFVYQLIWSGKLEANKVQKVWLIPASAIDARRKGVAK